MISNSQPNAIFGLTLDNLPDKNIAAIAEKRPFKVNKTKVYLSTWIPVYCADSGLFPIEYIRLPIIVLCKIKAKIRKRFWWQHFSQTTEENKDYGWHFYI